LETTKSARLGGGGGCGGAGEILTPKQLTARLSYPRLTKPSNYTTPCMRSSISA